MEARNIKAGDVLRSRFDRRMRFKVAKGDVATLTLTNSKNEPLTVDRIRLPEGFELKTGNGFEAITK